MIKSRLRRALLSIAALLVLGNLIWFSFVQIDRSDPEFIWLDNDGGYARFNSTSSTVRQISISLEKSDPKIPNALLRQDIKRVYDVRSNEILDQLNESENYQRGHGNFPLFVSLGDDATFGEFLSALKLLREAQICSVGFDELWRVNPSSPLQHQKMVDVFSLCP